MEEQRLETQDYCFQYQTPDPILPLVGRTGFYYVSTASVSILIRVVVTYLSPCYMANLIS